MCKRTQLDDVSNDPHNDKSHANRLRDFDEFTLIGWNGLPHQYCSSSSSKRRLQRGSSFKILMDRRHTLCAAIQELCAISDEIPRNVREFLQLFGHFCGYAKVGSRRVRGFLLEVWFLVAWCDNNTGWLVKDSW